MATRLVSSVEASIQTIEHHHGGIAERFLNVAPAQGEGMASFLARLHDCGTSRSCVAVDVFGGMPDATAMHALGALFGKDAVPLTWVIEEDTQPGAIHAVHAWMLEGAPVRRLVRDGIPYGSVFEDDHATYVRLGGLVPAKDADRGAQTRDMLEIMLAGLAEAGLDFSHVVRTWFYNDHILDWYDVFNAVRDEFFREHAVFDGIVPASTGMGGGNAQGRALTGGLLAVRPKTADACATRVDSPLQCPAWNYGSSFSRAIEVATPHARRLLISGTASIAQEGHTLFEGDLEAQMRQTFDVVHAILASRGMDWRHVTRALGYFKPQRTREDAWQLLKRYAPPVPIAPVINHVCRDNLLFETEVDAVLVTSNGEVS